MKKILAFTLAEVLVVMGIIGVVAAITIPTLSNTTNEKEVVAKVNKAASEITDAYGRARAKYGRYPLTWGTNGSKIPTRILEFMQVQTSCPGYNMSGSACMQRHAKTLIDGDSYNLPSQEGAILASGMSIAFSNCLKKLCSFRWQGWHLLEMVDYNYLHQSKFLRAFAYKQNRSYYIRDKRFELA